MNTLFCAACKIRSIGGECGKESSPGWEGNHNGGWADSSSGEAAAFVTDARLISLPVSPTPAAALPPPALALPSSSPSRRRFLETELPRANYPLRPESSRCDPGRAQSRHAEECRTLGLPGRSRSARELLLPSCRGLGKSCAGCPGDEYESNPTPIP